MGLFLVGLAVGVVTVPAAVVLAVRRLNRPPSPDPDPRSIAERLYLLG